MKKYKVSGMSCAACSSRVEKAVNSLNGVSSCNVSLLTNTLVVDGNVTDTEIISAVENAGYEAELFEGSSQSKESQEELNFKKIKNRLVFSVIILIPLMYLSMGKMLSLPIPEFLSSNILLAGIIQMVLSAVVMFINRIFFINAYKSLIHRNPNMDVLVSMGSLASFVYSVYLLFEITEAQLTGNMTVAHELAHSLYFESAAMIFTLISVGKLLEARSKGKTTNA
ncbi:MAG: cation-translocating P-type ATPase, partial [Clostridia bacterium]|nr:cation-translocating P-type ATPase [Clostridia bacterium]